MNGITPAAVFFAEDPVLTRQFYETIGLDFVEEQHDEGPVHYGHDFAGMVVEIYPRRTKRDPKKFDDSVMWLYYVADLDRVLAGLEAMGLRPTLRNTYGKEDLPAANIRDPDGRLVRLCHRDPCLIQ
jgi:lactoylglutathione lyase